MFEINAMSRLPVYEQLVEQVERYVLLGLLPVGSQMPSVRALSVELTVNPNTIQKAYAELESRGVFLSVPGRGSFIAEDAAVGIRKRRLGEQGSFRRMIRELKAAGMTEHELVVAVTAEFGGQTEENKGGTVS